MMEFVIIQTYVTSLNWSYKVNKIYNGKGPTRVGAAIGEWWCMWYISLGEGIWKDIKKNLCFTLKKNYNAKSNIMKENVRSSSLFHLTKHMFEIAFYKS